MSPLTEARWMRAAVIIAALGSSTLGSCAFAQKHPGITAGIVTGTIALLPCLPAVEHPTTCLAISAAAGVAIGGITGLVMTFADTTDHSLPPDQELEDSRRIRTTTPPPPGPAPEPGVPADAGVASPTTPSPDAGVPVVPADAATP
jgi:hypothetical protein